MRPADKLQSKAATIIPLVGLARSKQDPINRGHGAQYLYRPPPALNSNILIHITGTAILWIRARRLCDCSWRGCSWNSASQSPLLRPAPPCGRYSRRCAQSANIALHLFWHLMQCAKFGSRCCWPVLASAAASLFWQVFFFFS